MTLNQPSNARYRALHRALGSWWLFFPTLFWFVATNLLVGAAWGFPRFWVGIVALWLVGALALVSLGGLAAQVAGLFSEERGLLVARPSVPAESSATAAPSVIDESGRTADAAEHDADALADEPL